jgi:hypothetical protein
MISACTIFKVKNFPFMPVSYAAMLCYPTDLKESTQSPMGSSISILSVLIEMAAGDANDCCIQYAKQALLVRKSN